MVTLELPYPPSLNHMYGKQGKRFYLLPEVKAYRNDVFWIVRQTPQGARRMSERLRVCLTMHPPGVERRRDADNVPKVVFDALTKAGLWCDDSQIDDLRVIRRESRDPPVVILNVEPIDQGFA